MDAIRMVQGYGLTVDRYGLDDEDPYLDTPEATFLFQEDGVAVTMWSGSYPFASDHDMGVLPTLEEAVRYAVWLLKREERYAQEFDKMFTEESD